MKILSVKKLQFKEIKIIRFQKFRDERGYFTESFRKSDIFNDKKLDFLKNFEFVQFNESLSKKNTIRGLHFQWNPYMGKLVRTVQGKMVDIILDIRVGSANFGKALLYKMFSDNKDSFGEWIWIPPGFAHGNFFMEKTVIEYLCTGEYNPYCEASISPISVDINWELAEKELLGLFKGISPKSMLISPKDRKGYSVNNWAKTQLSNNFKYRQLH